jgi:pimeloyl-ACP methyl ester carboxylesterase
MRKKLVALVGAAAGAAAAGVAAERAAVKKRRRADPEATAAFGERRGERSRTITLDDGAEIFIEEVGPKSKSGVIFIHGSALRTDVWYYQMAGLDRRRLIFYDMRGHGRSEPSGRDDFSVTRLARDLEAIIEDCGLKEVVVVGHSIGGMLALELGGLRPELLGAPIKGITLVNATYTVPMETIAGGAALARLERIIRRPLDFVGRQSTRIDTLRKLVRPSDALFWSVAFIAFGPQASAKQIDYTYDMVAETRSETIFDLFKAYRDFDMTDRLGDVTVPVLVVTGTHDRITLPEASRHLADNLPKAELEVFEGCGHMTMMERHEEFNALLTRFLDDTLGRRK